MLHEKDAPASGLLKILGRRGVRKGFIIEAAALVLDNEFDETVFQKKAEINIFLFVATITMLDGIVHSFCYSDHDIAVNVIVKLKLLFCVVNKAFNHSNVFHDGRNLDTDRIHEECLTSFYLVPMRLKYSLTSFL